LFFALRGVSSQTKYCCSLNVKVLPPNFGLAALLPAPCSKNNISVISVFTLRNILIVYTEITKDKLSNIFSSETCIKLVALCNNLHTRVALSFKKVGDPCCRAPQQKVPWARFSSPSETSARTTMVTRKYSAISRQQ